MTEAKVVSLPTQKEESADSAGIVSGYRDLQNRAKELMKPFVMKLEAYDIPDDKIEAVIDFATKTYAKYHRQMKEPRMLRKVVEQFKLKLIPQENEPAN